MTFNFLNSNDDDNDEIMIVWASCAMKLRITLIALVQLNKL